MKKTLLLFSITLLACAVMAQKAVVKSHLKSTEPTFKALSGDRPINQHVPGMAIPAHQQPAFKNMDVVSLVPLGTSANAYSYGYNGGQRSILFVNNTLNTVTHFHRMGGDLDPGGYSGDLGYDISTDRGLTWTNMIECYVATENAGGQYFTDAARYPNHGIYNPVGNTDPDNAYITFFCPNLDNTNDPELWGGYSFGRTRIGDIEDTTKHLRSSRPADGVYQEVPDGFCMTSTGDVWVIDVNENWTSGSLVYEGSLIVNHGTWNEELMDYEYEEMLFELPVQPASTVPSYADVEFSPDGQYGYIVALADDGSVDISKDQSYFPVMWRTDDGGETWSDPFAVPLAGNDGIGAVQGFLSDEEIAELFEAPVPDRDEIPFTTAFDCDLSVDKYGNPHLAVIVGVTGSDVYSIVSAISTSSGYMFTAAFMISSMDKGEEGTWIGYELGRPVSFRGEFGTDYTEDNRIQISRDPEGEKMFVSWLDTDTTVSDQNNAPDVWVRGVDIDGHILTKDDNGEARPINVTFGSEATFSAYFFTQANETFTDNEGNFLIPYTVQNMNPNDPTQPVEYSYIKDFEINESAFWFFGIEDEANPTDAFMEVTGISPNPASHFATVGINLRKPAAVTVRITNLMGRNVRTVQHGRLQAGINNLTLELNDLNSGIYFYTVEAGNTTVSRKLIVE